VELQIPYCVGAKISKKDHIWAVTARNRKILRKLCEYKGIEIVEANACTDHIHMCMKIPPKYSVAQIMGYLKGKSSLMLFEKFQNQKYKFGNRTFWCKGYYVSTVGLNKETIRKYIRNQEEYDKMNET
jgi:putative transposase